MTQPITYTAYRIALMIIESEDFELEVNKDENGDKVFKLVDDNSANWGDIESDEFYNLASVIDRLEAYHDDYYFKEFEEKRNPDILSGKIPPNLSNGKPFEKHRTLLLSVGLSKIQQIFLVKSRRMWLKLLIMICL